MFSAIAAAVSAFFAGTFVGVVLMCCLQIHRLEK